MEESEDLENRRIGKQEEMREGRGLRRARDG